MGFLEEQYFDALSLGLHAPLSTLRKRPRGRPRMTRGRCGWLGLHRNGLTPSTSCRFLRRTLTLCEATTGCFKAGLYRSIIRRWEGRSRKVHRLDQTRSRDEL